MKTKRLFTMAVRFAFTVIGSAMAFGVLGTISRAVAAPPQAPILPARSTSEAEMVSFTKALETLSRRYNIAFICEDAPAADTLPAEVLKAALQKGDAASGDEAAQKAAETVAEAFDYAVLPHGATFLLQKRFSEFSPLSGELPSVTLQECALAMRDTERATNPFNPHISLFNKVDDLCGRLMTTLTQDQLSAMFNGSVNLGNTVNHQPLRGVAIDGTPIEGRQQKSSKGTVEVGLPVRSLSPSQRDDVYKIARYYFVQAPLSQMEQEAPLSAIVNPSAVFRRETVQAEGSVGGKGVGCVVPGKPGEKQTWYTLYADYDPAIGKTQTPSGTMKAFFARYTSPTRWPGIPFRVNDPHIDTYITGLQRDMKQDDEAARAQSDREKNRRKKNKSQSLTEVAHWLNTRLAPAKDSVRVAVDAALAAKRVTIVGADRQDNMTLWSNIARVYDLSTSEMPGGVVVITRPRQIPVRKIGDLPGAMRRVLPRPLRPFASSSDADGKSRYEAQQDLGKVAAARFHVIANAVFARSPTGEFKLSDLDEEGQQCLALMLIGTYGIQGISQLAQPVPPFLANFDDRLLVGGLYIAPDGETQFSFGFAKEDNPGALSQGPGFGGVKYKH